jgi:hypothetical protein
VLVRARLQFGFYVAMGTIGNSRLSLLKSLMLFVLFETWQAFLYTFWRDFMKYELQSVKLCLMMFTFETK